MKIEMGESLLFSWLKHIKECQIVQTNWKASNKWELKNKELFEQLMNTSREFFQQKYDYDIYKGTKSIDQLIGQAEIDVLGISFDQGESQFYAIDIAFHENGLNYGSKEETIARIIKKCLRTTMCINGYFGFKSGTVIFASPKINPSVEQGLMSCIDDMNQLLKNNGIDYKIRIIANDDFSEKILEPVLNVLGEVADTNELFMRSLQMYNLFASKKSKTVTTRKPSTISRVTADLEKIESHGMEGLEEMKIGAIVRTVLRNMLETGKVSKEEIELMQTKEYSRDTFHIQYPLLQKASLTHGIKPKRYYSSTLKIYGEEYYLCSEWFEVPTNNDRPYLMKWLGMRL